MNDCTLPLPRALLFLPFLFFLLPVGAVAQDDLSYTFIEVDYLLQDIDLFEDDDFTDDFLEDVDDGDGFGVQGSFAITSNIFLFGSYTSTEAEFSFIDDTGVLVPQDEDVKTLKLGAGFNMPMASGFHLVGRAAYMDVDLGDFDLGAVESDVTTANELEAAFRDLNDDTSDGFFLDVGARAQMIDWLEGGIGVRYTDIHEDYFSVFGNLLFEISQNFGINIAADIGDELSTYSAGVRLSF